MALEFREYREDLFFEKEYSLNTKPWIVNTFGSVK